MKYSRGFSLIEMMIAITIGIILTGAAIAVFLTSRVSYSTTSGVDQISESGRFALDFLRNSIRTAGFIGCSDSDANPTVVGASQVINALNLGTDSMPINFTQGLMGYEYTSQSTTPGASYTMSTPAVDTTSTHWTPTLDAALISAGVVAGTDVIVVHSGTTTAPVNVTSIVNSANNFTVSGTTGYTTGQLAVISNCLYATTFQISNIAGNVISHASGAAAGTNAAAAFTYNYAAGAMMFGVDTQIYYIGIGEDGDGALMMLDLNSGTNAGGPTSFQTEELVPDVENMQVLYGYDTTGAQSASEYFTAASIFPSTLNPYSIMSVKVALLVASPINTVPKPTTASVFNMLGTLVTAPLDTRQRQVFDATIAIRDALP